MSAGTQYDQLIVSGTAQLDGTLTLVLVNGFTPAGGTVFTVMTYGAHAGSLAIAGGGEPYAARYAATGLAITAGAPAQETRPPSSTGRQPGPPGIRR